MEFRMTSEQERGLRPIGSLDLTSELSPPNWGSTPETLLPASGTTGTESPARPAGSSTGLQRGETGAVATLMTALDGLDPAETDRTLAALWAQRYGSPPVAQRTPIYDQPGGYDDRLDGYSPPPYADGDVIGALEVACRRADPDVVTKELARLKVATLSRKQADAELEMWFEVAGEELEEFPADVVRAACRAWIRREKWAPSVAELIDECQRMFLPRKLLRLAARG